MADQVLVPYTQEGRIAPLDTRSGLETLYFRFSLPITPNDGAVTLAPHSFRRTYAANYVPVQVALSSHLPEEWRSNAPVVMPIEFEVISQKKQTIDGELRKLRRMMKKDARTGEPPDLVFVMGVKQWTVRIFTMDVTPTVWNQQLDEVRARVTLTFHTTVAED